VPVHPLPLVPVAVYTIVEAGVTTTTDPGNEPGFQVYVTAPLADKVAVPPVQTDGEPVEAITEGFAFMLTLIEVVPVQDPLTPTTEYVVAMVGETTVTLVVAPVLHVYDVAPVTDKDVLLPKQTAVGVALAVNDNEGELPKV